MSFVMKRSLLAVILVGSVALAVNACERVLAPEHSAIGNLRRQATKGVGSFVGRVRARDAQLPCWRSPRVVPGARVEVGLWDGIPAFYRDTVSRRPQATAKDPRFQILASSVTDAEGRFRFDSMPRGVAYAMRVIPPDGSSWSVGYGESLYGVPSDETIAAFQAQRERSRKQPGGTNGDFPILCLLPRDAQV
jgi:hypothetical protein